MQQKVNEYLRELTTICRKYEMWPEGKEMVLVDNNNQPVTKDLEYDHEWGGLAATFLEKF